MTPTASTLLEYEREAKQSTDDWLGTLMFVSVHDDALVKHDLLKSQMEAHGFGDHVPYKPSDANCFRRVSSSAARKGQILGDPSDNVKSNFLIRDVANRQGKVSKQIVVERVNRSETLDDALRYRKMMEITHHPDSSTVTSTPLDTYNDIWERDENGNIATSWDGRRHVDPRRVEEQSIADEISREIETKYNAQRGLVSPAAVRGLINSVLSSCKAVSVRASGGVFFVSQDLVNRAEGLESFTANLRGVDLHSLPLVDSTKQRNMVQEAFVHETSAEVDRVVIEITEILNGPPISAKRYAGLAEKLKDAKSKARHYEKVLESQSQDVDLSIQALNSKIVRLSDHVEKG